MQTTLDRPRPSTQIQRTPFDFAAIFIGLTIAALLFTIAGWQFLHANRIYTGVQIGNIPVGGLTRSTAMVQLSQELQPYPLPPISLEYAGQKWPLLHSVDGSEQPLNDSLTTAFNVQADLLRAINQAYLLGRQGNVAERLIAQLGLAFSGHNIVPPLTFDTGQLRYFVTQVANDVRQPARPGSQVRDVVVPPQPGLDVNIESTLQQFLAILQSDLPDKGIVIPLEVIQFSASDTLSSSSTEAISTEASVQALDTLDPETSSLSTPLILNNARFNLEFAIDPARLNELIQAKEPLRVDKEKTYQFLESWAAQIDVAPRNARLKFNPNTSDITVLQTSQAGQKLDIDATFTSIEQALTNGILQAHLAVVDVPPAVDMNRIHEMGIRELVASGTSYFAGSSAARIHNIEVAASKFQGVVIPPGEIFSFNYFVEDVSSANGFDESLIILGDRTAVGVGGGVCQVSTTVFRAAFAAGMPIVERYNHGYVVDWYGEPGMDATIYTPTVDFRFRNDSNAYLVIDPVVDSQRGIITFNFYGTKPNRQVIVSAPVRTDVIEPEPPLYREDPGIAPGQQKQVEWPNQGMVVNVQRTIIEDGVTRIDTLTSQYHAWRAVYLVAPGTDISDTSKPSDDTSSAEENTSNPDAP